MPSYSTLKEARARARAYEPFRLTVAFNLVPSYGSGFADPRATRATAVPRGTPRQASAYHGTSNPVPNPQSFGLRIIFRKIGVSKMISRPPPTDSTTNIPKKFA